MRLRDKLSKAISPVAIPNITLYWIALQIICMMLVWMQKDFYDKLVLDPAKVMQGEWWRLITFLFMPKSLSPIWAAFVYYVFWLMGTALEINWGDGPLQPVPPDRRADEYWQRVLA